MREIQSIIDYKFKNVQILQEALLLPGRQSTILATDTFPSRLNRDLAIIGDAVLRLAIVQAWYKTRESRG